MKEYFKTATNHNFLFRFYKSLIKKITIRCLYFKEYFISANDFVYQPLMT